MAISRIAPLPLLLILLASCTAPVCGQSREETTVRTASAVLNEIMVAPANNIPRSMLADAQGVAIIPNVIKGSFVVGARHGRGVLVIRDELGNWRAPVFVSLTGGNVGWQIGLQSTDVILVFKTQKSIQGILDGKLTLGGDASVAAGPVGRQASAATDLQLKAEIYSYSRSRGLFAGLAVDGSVLQVDSIATASYYQTSDPSRPAIVPPSAIQLGSQIAQYAGAAQLAVAEAGPQTVPPAGPAPQFSAGEPEVLRQQLSQIAPQLYRLVDPQWSAYLALPAEVFTGNGHPQADALQSCLQRFESVATNPSYATLAERPEFQSTYGLLRHYAAAQRQEETQLQLPPPPNGG